MTATMGDANAAGSPALREIREQKLASGYFNS
jgi:hypothetical protein